MRGSLAKALRATCKRALPLNLSPESRYTPKRGTARVRTALAPQLQPDGSMKLVEVKVPTVTFELAPDCVRYFTQRFKHTVLKNRRTQQ